MRNTWKAVAVAAIAVLAALPARADRQYTYCDPVKSTLCSGLVSLYEFEEASDFARTSEVGGSRFVEPDGADVANSATHKTGSFSLAHTAVANSYLVIPRAVGPTGQFTVSFWLYVDTMPSASTKQVQILSMRDPLGVLGAPRIRIYNTTGTNNLGYVVTQAITDTSGSVISTTALSTATWYHVAFGQYPDATSTLPYQQKLWISVNAGARQTASITYGDVSTIGDLIVGAWSNTSPQEYGAYKIDQLAVWRGTLSPADVTKLYNAGAGKEYPFVD